MMLFMMMNIDTNPRGMIQITLTSRLTGKSRRTFLKLICVVKKVPVGTSRKNALVMDMTSPTHNELFANLTKNGYEPKWVPCESTWMVSGDYDVSKRCNVGYTVYRDRGYASHDQYDNNSPFRHMSYEAAVALMNAVKRAAA